MTLRANYKNDSLGRLMFVCEGGRHFWKAFMPEAIRSHAMLGRRGGDNTKSGGSTKQQI